MQASRSRSRSRKTVKEIKLQAAIASSGRAAATITIATASTVRTPGAAARPLSLLRSKPRQALPPRRRARSSAQAAASQQRDRGPQQHQRHDRPNDRGSDRGRDSRPPRQQGKQPFAASAAPKKGSAAIDPDLPFAALSQLKERMEKKVQTQDETV